MNGEHRGPLSNTLQSVLDIQSGTNGEDGREGGLPRREGGGGCWIARGRGRVPPRAGTLKQEGWNERLAWSAAARKEPERWRRTRWRRRVRRREKPEWRRGPVCGCWYGAQSSFAHHLLSSRTQPPFQAEYVPYLRAVSSAPVVYSTSTLLLLFILLLGRLPTSASLFLSPLLVSPLSAP